MHEYLHEARAGHTRVRDTWDDRQEEGTTPSRYTREKTGLVTRDRVGKDAHNPYVALRVLMPNGLKVGRCRIPDNSVTVWRQAISSHKCRVRPNKESI